MAKSRPVLPLVSDELVYLKSSEALMRGRVVVEQQTISGLRALLEGAPTLPERRLSWHTALEKFLDGTREELYARMESVRTLERRMKDVRSSISQAEMYVRDLNHEFSNLESTGGVDSAAIAAITSYRDWRDCQSAVRLVGAVDTPAGATDVTIQERLSNLLSSGRTRRDKKDEYMREMEKAQVASKKYLEQDLIYRRTVHRHRKSQEKFLDSVSHRVQEYGARYQAAVSDLGVLMESFANYLRDISGACNSSGSALWASAKDIKPLIDANSHTEIIEMVYHPNPVQFSPVFYQNAGTNLTYQGGQTILFGCSLELHINEQLKKVPPVLEYLLDSLPVLYEQGPIRVHLQPWILVNKIEEAWTGVEENDRAIISKYDLYSRITLLLTYFNTLPDPILSFEDVVEVPWSHTTLFHQPRRHADFVWDSWSQDPIKATVLPAVLACLKRVAHKGLSMHLFQSLTQNENLSSGDDGYFKDLVQHPEIWSSPESRARIHLL